MFLITTGLILIAYLSNQSEKKRRINDAAARAASVRKAREENQKKQHVSAPPFQHTRIIKKRPELSDKQRIDKITNDDDHIENIELWSDTDPAELTNHPKR